MQQLPQFSKIQVDRIKIDLEKIILNNRQLIQNLLKQNEFTWDNLVQPIEDMRVELDNFWAVISHLQAVLSTDALRVVFETCLLCITAYFTEVGTNKDLYKAYKKIKDSDAFHNLSRPKKKSINNAIRDFELAGVALEGEAKEEYQQIQLKLSELSNQFQDNLMDATDSWFKLIEDDTLLAGISEHVKQVLRQNAEKKQLSGWLVTLDFPTFYAIVAYADDRQLRQEIYTAYFTRASDQGPHCQQYDNSEIMFDILNYRDKKAKLLGFKHFGEYSLATKMASSTEEVMHFLIDLAEKIKPIAEFDWNNLVNFAHTKLQMNELNAWDVAYASEKLRREQYNLSQDELRHYFEITYVTKGLFQIAEILYGIKIVEKKEDFDKWHNDVSFYEVYTPEKQLIAGFYLDLYARPKKRGGAWMDSCRARHKKSTGKLQLPIAFLVCNFNQPLKGSPSLLTHDEVRTLFHEFGHGLHHMLTEIDIASVSGLNGVAWDAVEFPSQFMENWCWHQLSLNLVACHHQDKTPLPHELFQRLIANKNFQVGIQMLRQLEYALFDIRVHSEFSGENKIQVILDEIRQRYAVVPVPEFHRFQHSFSHIFAGGYAAGFYSYKWAEVLSCDAFSCFEKEGIFNSVLANKFRHCILEKGGSEDASQLFFQYQGRSPNHDALLKMIGISPY